MAFSFPSPHDSVSVTVNPLREFRQRIIAALEAKKHVGKYYPEWNYRFDSYTRDDSEHTIPFKPWITPKVIEYILLSVNSALEIHESMQPHWYTYISCLLTLSPH